MTLQLLEPVAESQYGNRPEDGRYHTRYLEAAQFVARQVLDAGWAIRTEKDGDLFTVRWWR